MRDVNEDLGQISRQDGEFQAVLSRRFTQAPDQVWAMLTESDKLPLWLAPGSIELKLGGAAKLNFVDSGIVIDSQVTALESERLLEYAWSSPGEPVRPVRWVLAPSTNGTLLRLQLRLPADEDIARASAGWEAHLQMLLAAIEGVPIKFPFERFKTTREAYRAMAEAL